MFISRAVYYYLDKIGVSIVLLIVYRLCIVYSFSIYLCVVLWYIILVAKQDTILDKIGV